MNIKRIVDHRPWPLPPGSFLMHQSWLDLLFAHWPVPVKAIRDLVPHELPIDTFDDMAWIGVVPFRMAGIRLRGLPPVPFTSAFPELNVRTYVTYKGKRGVYFFSLDAANRFAVRTARRFYHLPYLFARMSVERSGDEIRYDCRRDDPHGSAASFSGTYRPIADPYEAQRGSLEHWLTERYCLYAAGSGGALYRGDIHHAPWPLQHAEADITANTMAEASGVTLPGIEPVLHFARRLDVLIWNIRKV